MQKAQSEAANVAIRLSIAVIIGNTDQVWSSTCFYSKYEDNLLLDTGLMLHLPILFDKWEHWTGRFSCQLLWSLGM